MNNWTYFTTYTVVKGSTHTGTQAAADRVVQTPNKPDWIVLQMIWYDIYSFAHGTTLSMKQSSDNIVK